MPLFWLTESERQTYRRYATLALPRHTSYPIVPAWRPTYGPEDFHADLRELAQEGRPLSLYVHIPFCEHLCYYCACSKEIVPSQKRWAQDPAEILLAGLEVETGRFAAAVGCGEVRQVHLGGGSPTFLTPEQLERLGRLLRQRFAIAADAEMAIELDPRTTTHQHLEVLRHLGFNRVSLGIQDFDPRVQGAVNRLQPPEMVERLVGWCRSLGLGSINFDLIYGLPFQTIESMDATLAQTIALAPDRIAFYRLAVIPEIFRWQNVFHAEDLPAGDLPLELNLLAINRFLEAGYEFIGLDHFARSDDALTVALREGSLQRTFQGMTTGKGLAVLGLGPSAISDLAGAYAQNVKAHGAWWQALQASLATERGLRLSADDRLRRELLQQLYGYGAINKRVLEEQFDIAFDSYFAAEQPRLRELVEEGLVLLGADAIQLSERLGRLLVRVVAAAFDRYLPPGACREGLPAHLSSRVG